jgi:hypothetical protein
MARRRHAASLRSGLHPVFIFSGLILITSIPSAAIYDLLDSSKLPPDQSRRVDDLFVTGDNLAELAGHLNRHASDAGREDIRTAMADHLVRQLVRMSVRVSARRPLSGRLAPPPITGKLAALLAVGAVDSTFVEEIAEVTALVCHFSNRTECFCDGEYDEVMTPIRNAVLDYAEMGILKLATDFASRLSL